MTVNHAIADYIRAEVPANLQGQVLSVLTAYCEGEKQPVTFTGTRELARHMDAIASIIDNRGVYDERIAQGGC